MKLDVTRLSLENVAIWLTHRPSQGFSLPARLDQIDGSGTWACSGLVVGGRRAGMTGRR